MTQQRSKRPWQLHEDALLALEESRDVDTKVLVTGAGHPSFSQGGTSQADPELLDIERKRLSYESARTNTLRFIAFLMVSAVAVVIISSFAGDDLKKLGEDKPDIETWQELKAKNKALSNLAGLVSVKKIFLDVLTPDVNDIDYDPKGRAKSILMFGPPGCGKTEIAKCAAADTQYNYLEVTGGKIVGSYVGQSGKAIRANFKLAKANQPCIIFFDEVETILKARGSDKGRNMEDDRTVSEFLTEMNAVFDAPDDKVIIIGATNIPESLDSAAVRRFHRRVYIPIPGKEGRIAILNKELDLKVGKKVAEEFAKITYGFSSSNVVDCAKSITKRARGFALQSMTKADLAAFSKNRDALRARLQSSAKQHITAAFILSHARSCKGTVKSSSLAAYRQWAAQFGEKAEPEDEASSGEIRPISAFDLDDDEKKMAERKVRTPDVNAKGLDQIYGIQEVKERLRVGLRDAIIYSEEARKSIFTPLKTFLMYGPPGTGKSVIAQAVAKTVMEELKKENVLEEKPINFIAITASDIKGKYIGESEKNLSSWFRIAEAYQPAVLFIDEIETLLVNRTGTTQANDGGAGLSLLGTFLQMMDGSNVDKGRQVVVLAATNDPNNIDSAVRRRFAFLHVPLPDDEAREQFFCDGLYKRRCSDVPLAMKGVKQLAEVTKGYSGSDIKQLIDVAREAAMKAQRKRNPTKKITVANLELRPIHFRYALAIVQPSVADADVQKCNDFAGAANKNDRLDAIKLDLAKEGIEVAQDQKSEKQVKEPSKGLFGEFTLPSWSRTKSVAPATPVTPPSSAATTPSAPKPKDTTKPQ
jgi:SpoVK/Ycf46/Vps4 family AAA+-type ATPase